MSSSKIPCCLRGIGIMLIISALVIFAMGVTLMSILIDRYPLESVSPVVALFPLPAAVALLSLIAGVAGSSLNALKSENHNTAAKLIFTTVASGAAFASVMHMVYLGFNTFYKIDDILDLLNRYEDEYGNSDEIAWARVLIALQIAVFAMTFVTLMVSLVGVGAAVSWDPDQSTGHIIGSNGNNTQWQPQGQGQAKMGKIGI